MRKFINYIRSLFCDHEWEYLGIIEHYSEYDTETPLCIIERWRCSKCGYIVKDKT